MSHQPALFDYSNIVSSDTGLHIGEVKTQYTMKVQERQMGATFYTALEQAFEKLISKLDDAKKTEMGERLQRGLEMAKTGHVIPTGTPGIYHVFSSGKAANPPYTVNTLARPWTCDCPDAAKGNKCKHAIASYIYQQAMMNAPATKPTDSEILNQILTEAQSVRAYWSKIRCYALYYPGDSAPAIPVEIVSIFEDDSTEPVADEEPKFMVQISALPLVMDVNGEFMILPQFPFNQAGHDVTFSHTNLELAEARASLRNISVYQG